MGEGTIMRPHPENIYGAAEMTEADRAAFEAALDNYLRGRFAEAGLGFSKVSAQIGQYMRNRCAELEAGAPSGPGTIPGSSSDGIARSNTA